MKTLVLFYSYTGHTQKLAQEIAGRESADIAEIKDKKRPGKLKAYSVGCFAAMRGKSWPIELLGVNLASYDNIKIFSPVWAGNPPPAVNAVLTGLPEGKRISLMMVSTSGKSACKERMETSIGSKGCTLSGFEDVKA